MTISNFPGLNSIQVKSQNNNPLFVELDIFQYLVMLNQPKNVDYILFLDLVRVDFGHNPAKCRVPIPEFYHRFNVSTLSEPAKQNLFLSQLYFSVALHWKKKKNSCNFHILNGKTETIQRFIQVADMTTKVIKFKNATNIKNVCNKYSFFWPLHSLSMNYFPLTHLCYCSSFIKTPSSHSTYLSNKIFRKRRKKENVKSNYLTFVSFSTL